jgi:hypothetical protein
MRRLDRRLDWRDPAMPCIRVTEDVWSGEIASELVPPEVVQAVAIEGMGVSRASLDPSYHWGLETAFRRQERLEASGFPVDCLDDCKTPLTCKYAGCHKLEVGE